MAILKKSASDIDARKPPPRMDAAQLVAAAKRITVKVGSSLLIDSGESAVREAWLAGLCSDFADLLGQGKQLILVSSGAVALGREHLGLKRSARLDMKQAAAAAGQPRLMQAWDRAMAGHDVLTAQLLLTIEDTEARRRWLNARATMEVLLARGVLPVINENDSVATEELRYGDNDRLSARVAQMMQCDLLILLSDVDGIYTRDPAKHPSADHLPYLAYIGDEIDRYAGASSGAGPGSGGMQTKVSAARIARGCGCATIIASGRQNRPLSALAAGAKATVIAASGSPASAYKHWILGTLTPAGSLAIDAGARKALREGKSLLPAGVTRVDGSFERGVCLRVLDWEDKEIARGITAYNSIEAEAIKGHPSQRIAELLGYGGPDELIHRNDMVLT